MRPRHLLMTAICVCEFALLSPAFGQENAGRRGVGLTASVQGAQLDIMMPIWVGDKTSIAPSVGLLWSEDVGSDLRLGLVPHFYFSRERFSPYVGGRLGALISTPSVGSSSTDLLLGWEAGGEYLLDDHVAFGVEAQLNMTKSGDHSSRFGNPGKWTINTGSAVFATVYF